METVFDASYLVMGRRCLSRRAGGYPLDPRHRLVTTKYNPARTWTAENSVGIGGAYLCVYGMEGPGGYQFVGRTLQMWNRYHEVADFAGKPGCCAFSISCVSIRFRPMNCWRFAAISRSVAIRCASSTARCGWRNTSSFSLARRRALRVSRPSAAGV
jgi:urea carboxylase